MRRTLSLLCPHFLVVLVAVMGALIWVPHVAAAVQWTVETIHTEATDEIDEIMTQGDFVVWTTYSRVDGSAGLYVYRISTGEKRRIAGPDLPYHYDFDLVFDGSHVAWGEYRPGEESSYIVLYDIVTEQYKRLTGSAADYIDDDPDIQGDWLVWTGAVAGPGSWVYDPVVFAYRISTSGPVKIVRWRDKETMGHDSDYRSMDDSPFVYGGKVTWRFIRPDGKEYLGIEDLATGAVDWTWQVPAGLKAWPTYVTPTPLWEGNLLIKLSTPQGSQPVQSGLMVRPAGAATPVDVRPLGPGDIGSYAIKNGLMAWTEGDVYYRMLGGQTVRVTTKPASQSYPTTLSMETDGSHVVWHSQTDGMVWWHDVTAGQSMSIPGSVPSAFPGGDGVHVVWKGGYAFENGRGIYRAVLLATQGQAADFPDVPSSNPYAAAVNGMAARGIINGYAGGLFGVTDPVKRAQFAKMICGTMAIPVTEATWQDASRPFTDLGADDPAGLYPHDFVAAAAANNITKGVTPSTFEPYTAITRAQVITMIVRAAENLSPATLTAPPADYTPSISNFSDTHWPNLRKAEANGLLVGLQGYGSSWNPWQTATRGEVAQMLWNLLGKM